MVTIDPVGTRRSHALILLVVGWCWLRTNFRRGLTVNCCLTPVYTTVAQVLKDTRTHKPGQKYKHNVPVDINIPVFQNGL